jgi:hypothetical protein
MDDRPEADQPRAARAYTTPKRVQAWFLGRSRDRWREKYAALKAESRRLKQHVADACRSRDGWRDEALAVRRELAALRAEVADLRGRLGEGGDRSMKG